MLYHHDIRCLFIAALRHTDDVDYVIDVPDLYLSMGTLYPHDRYQVALMPLTYATYRHAAPFRLVE